MEQQGAAVPEMSLSEADNCADPRVPNVPVSLSARCVTTLGKAHFGRFWLGQHYPLCF